MSSENTNYLLGRILIIERLATPLQVKTAEAEYARACEQGETCTSESVIQEINNFQQCKNNYKRGHKPLKFGMIGNINKQVI